MGVEVSAPSHVNEVLYYSIIFFYSMSSERCVYCLIMRRHLLHITKFLMGYGMSAPGTEFGVELMKRHGVLMLWLVNSGNNVDY